MVSLPDSKIRSEAILDNISNARKQVLDKDKAERKKMKRMEDQAALKDKLMKFKLKNKNEKEIESSKEGPLGSRKLRKRKEQKEERKSSEACLGPEN